MALPRKVNWDRVDRIPSSQALARALWTAHALELSPDRFWCYFVRLYQHTDDMFCVWYAAGALRDYLRIHPGVLPVPRELVFRMLRYRFEDASSVGFKLLVICDDVSTNEIVEELMAGIRENDDSAHCCSAVHETSELLRQVRNGQRMLSSLERSELRVALSTVAKSNTWDAILRGMAAARMAELDGF